MSVTRRSGRKHSIKGKRTRGKRSVHHKRKHARKSNKKKRSAHHKRSVATHRRRKRTRSMRGRSGIMRRFMRGGTSGMAPATLPGSIVPADMSNTYRTSLGGVTNVMDGINGVESDPSPLPYKDQLVRSDDLVGEVIRMA